MHRLLYIISLMIVMPLTILVHGQSVPFDQDHFPNRADSLKKAKQSFEDGSIFFDNGRSFCKFNLEDNYCEAGWSFFEEGLSYLLEAQRFNPQNAELNFMIGMSYFTSPNKYNGIPYIQKAHSLDPDARPSLAFYAAQSFKLNRQWEPAMVIYNTLANTRVTNTETKENVTQAQMKAWASECKTALELITHDSVVISPMGENINTPFAEYGTAILANGRALLFTSKQDSIESDHNFVVYEEDSEKIESIYLSYKQSNGWGKSIKLQSPINDPEIHSSILAVSPNNKEVLVKKNNDIYRTSFIDGMWEELDIIEGEINSNETEHSACYFQGNSSVLFASDRKNGLGGFDIYIAELNEDKETISVKNIGKPINTEYDETGVFYHTQSKTIFFSSNRPGTIGSYDVFFSTQNNDGTWSSPQNIGQPINSPEDDMYFSVNKNLTKGFITSYRENTFGGKDIYEISFPTDFINFIIKPDIQESNLATENTIDEKFIKIFTNYRFKNTQKQPVYLNVIYNNDTVISIIDSTTTSPIIIPKVEMLTITANAENFNEVSQKLLLNDTTDSIAVNFIFDQKISASTTFLKPEKTDSVSISGWIMDADKDESINATVLIYDSLTNEQLASTSTNRRGKYLVNIPKNRNVRIEIKAESFLNQSGYISVPSSKNAVTIKSMMLSTDNPLLGSLYNKNDLMVSFQQLQKIHFDLDSLTDKDSLIVEVYEKKTNRLIKRTRINKNGLVSIVEGKEYSIRVKADGYSTVQYALNIPRSASGAIIKPQLTPLQKNQGREYIGTMFFESGRFLLNENEKRKLDKLLNSAPMNTAEYMVIGHTDGIGSLNSNNTLAMQRAKAIRDIMVTTKGINGDIIKTLSKGETEPVENNSTETGRAKNRRVDIFLIY